MRDVVIPGSTAWPPARENWPGGVTVEVRASEKSEPAFDETALLDSVGGDVDFLVELIGLFLAACPALLSRIQTGLATGDFDEAEHAVRILKGALRTFAAGDAVKSVEALQPALHRRQSEPALEAFQQVERQIGRLIPALSKLENSHLNRGSLGM